MGNTTHTEQERAQALAEKYGATSYRNRADTQNPAYGFTPAQLAALIAEVEQAASRAPVVAVPQDRASTLLARIRKEIDHAAINDHRMPPAFGKRIGDPCVKSAHLEATIGGWEKEAAAHQPPEAVHHMGDCENEVCQGCMPSMPPVTPEEFSHDIAEMLAAPVQLPEPDGLFSFGANDDKPTYHHGEKDKQWLNQLFDESVTGGPYRSEYAYSETKVRQLLAALPTK